MPIDNEDVTLFNSLLVNGLSTVVGLVGKELTPHVKKHGSKLIPESIKSNKDASANMTGAKVVATSSLKGEQFNYHHHICDCFYSFLLSI